ncbi:gephyrin-like molybdotransferase Glp [Granulicella cerasi]|uniref:Molybdopterin molybdenumtransferase n=1 Tax=Granulicella cerasi TaxID=741063 RepID=A0ABW1ZB10_9BACT|nr:gephyrin-like molybdotransferase Glp [Granulicella cerasi]
MSQVLSFEEALAVVLREAQSLTPTQRAEQVPLAQARGRVLAAPICTPRDLPPFDRSTRDGYALRAADMGARLRVVGQVRAGESWQGPSLAAGEAIELMTGAPLPAGADAVVMLEHVHAVDGTITLTAGREIAAGANVVPRGSEAHAGDTVLAAGEVVDAATVALAAGCGAATVTVFAQPTVAIIATGDELVELGNAQAPQPWEIYNSNSYSLAALAEAEGAIATRLPIARDTLADLKARLDEAALSDLLLMSGGVSAGKYDFVEDALAATGAEFFFVGARIQPGKPVVFGRRPRQHGGWQYFFGLPGNPVSTDVCFRLFVAPLLRALRGSRELTPCFVEATTGAAFAGKPELLRFLPARLEGGVNGVRVFPVEWQGSGDTAANARANCYCVVGPTGIGRGATARVLLR